jgi:hypothetical protein
MTLSKSRATRYTLGMPMKASALLRITDLNPAAFASKVTQTSVARLNDASLVHTQIDFSADPEEMTRALIALVGAPVLAAHQDPRGILFIPDVAAPTSRSYDALVAEVGEGGVWAPQLDAQALQLPDGLPEGLGGLLGNLLGQLPPSVLQAANAAAQGDRAAFDQLGAQVQALMGSSQSLQDLAGQLTGMLGGSDPASAPEKLEQLAQQLLGTPDKSSKK